ncbi:hypothetical protein FB472_0026 [Rhodoglobus vestalii]|uniref:Uncharacterized protein n=1 Tax=Rhodoglobus vestalii TaxID=193384 RepID=A0A8H2K1S7_9MICO|nr:hypothetical protein FB472_0026 [Rhodoglobus vestalii]
MNRKLLQPMPRQLNADCTTDHAPISPPNAISSLLRRWKRRIASQLLRSSNRVLTALVRALSERARNSTEHVETGWPSIFRLRLRTIHALFAKRNLGRPVSLHGGVHAGRASLTRVHPPNQSFTKPGHRSVRKVFRRGPPPPHTTPHHLEVVPEERGYASSEPPNSASIPGMVMLPFPHRACCRIPAQVVQESSSGCSCCPGLAHSLTENWCPTQSQHFGMRRLGRGFP